ncbi:DUF6515 family protein [Mucilaginibacter sp. L196]|uniref:DUF6515 family protein n=1 Tax=Mucilaginibacter sp. L196 TaxID=1641870 RepID=UPI00131ECE10|nr:DUF6515 family protein [Mucilaginibacter sp. L196]
MKNIIKSLSYSALAVMTGLALSLPANAQHRDGGGGGGNSRPAPQRSAPQSAPARSFTPRTNTASPQRSNAGQRNYNNNRQTTTQRSTNGITQTRQYSGHVPANTQSGSTARGYRPSAGSTQGSYYGRTHNSGFSGGVSVRAGFTARGNTYYHYNHGYYGSYYAPRLGFSIGILPYGYYPFYYGNDQYFYSGGLFYQFDNDQYTVVEPPVGAEVTTLPSNAQSIVINGQQYYEADGVYYAPITKDDGTLSYQVAGKDGELNTTDDPSVDNTPPTPQIGDIVNQLPPNCRKISVNGDKLYLSPDGIYYKAQVDQNGNKTYKIVGLPEDDDQNQPDQTSN